MYIEWVYLINISLIFRQIAQMNKHRLNKKDGIAPVVTGNWGCGQTSQGNVQLKLVIQWMGASLAGLPVLIYNTAGHEKLAKVKSKKKNTLKVFHLFNQSMFSISWTQCVVFY